MVDNHGKEGLGVIQELSVQSNLDLILCTMESHQTRTKNLILRFRKAILGVVLTLR